MEFDLPTTAAAFIAVIAVGVGGLFATPMTMDTIMMMVAPSMIVFGLLRLVLGVKHGEYRAAR